MLRHIFLIATLAVFCSLWLSACQPTPAPFECSDAIGCVSIAPDEPIKIGVLQGLSGGIAPGGTIQVRGIELVVAQRNAELLGHPIELQIEDEHCSTEGGTTAALKIIADPQVVGIFGTSCSGAAAPASKIMSAAGLVMVSGLNTAPSLTKTGGKQGTNWQPGYFRTIYNGVRMARTAATFAIQELAITKAATIDDGDLYTRELTNEFNRIFTELGGDVVLPARVNKGDVNMEPVLSAITSSGAELVYFPLFLNEAVFVIQQARAIAGAEGIILLGGESMGSAEFIEYVGADGLGLYITSTALQTGPAHEQFVSEYKEQFGDIPSHHAAAYAYDAATILLNAIETATEQDPDGALHIGRQALRDTLYGITALEGITGRLTCDEFGDCGAVELVILRLKDPSAGLEDLRTNVMYTSSSKQ